MSHDRRYVIILVLAGIIAALSGIVGNIAASALPEGLKPYLWIAWPLFIVLAGAGILLAVYQVRSDRKSPEPVKAVAPQPETSAESSTTIKRSGGIDVNANTVIVYGDIVGRNKEIDQAAKSDRPVDAPPRSIWYYAHPYPMPANFTGRAAERAMLTDWLNNDHDHPLLVIRALGGFGKSALAWHWLTHDVDPKQWPNVIWWSFYEGDSSFENFLRDALTALRIEPPTGPRQQVDALIGKLQESETLLVLDGFERLLRAFSGMNAVYQGDEERREDRDTDCTNPSAEYLIRAIATLPNLRGKVLMTTRLLPHALQVHGNYLQGCREVELTGLNPVDAVAYFHARNIRGTHTEIETACKPYEYHPLSLSLLAGLIVNDLQKPCDIVVAQRLNVMGDLKQQQHHILEVAYNSLTPDRQKLLSKIACFRSSVSYDALHALAKKKNEKNFDNNLHDLLARGLLHRDNRTNRYDLHPIVRRYAYDRLTANDRTTAHAQLRDYFAAVQTPDKVQTLDDLIPVIELYHHTVSAEQYDEARTLFRDRISNATYLQFGAYQLRIELLRTLFHAGEDRPSRLKDESHQAWTLNELAISYSLSGQPRRAVNAWETAMSLAEKLREKNNFVSGLENVAAQQIVIGALRAAEVNLNRALVTSRENEYKFSTAVEHLYLGQLLAYRGVWQESEIELATCWDQFIKVQSTKDWLSMTWAYRSQKALLLRDGLSAFKCAEQALAYSFIDAKEDYPIERNFIIDYWLLGAAYRLNGTLAEADRHLSEALTRCRNINMVDYEANILIDLARLRVDQNDREEALRLAQEALIITERSEYVLQGADVHLLMAQLALDANDKRAVLLHAREARRLATCDGEPYVYRVAYDEAGELLKKLGDVQ